MPARSKYQHHDPQVINEAVDAVRSKKMSLRGASKHFGISLTTLFDKVKGKRGAVKTPRYLLTCEEEEKLVNWLVQMAEVGFSAEDIRIKAKAILEIRGGTTKDPNNMPSQAWAYKLLSRYPQLSLR